MGVEVYYDGEYFSALSTVTMTTFARGIKTPEIIAKKIAQWSSNGLSETQIDRYYQKWLKLCTAIKNGRAPDFNFMQAGRRVSYQEARTIWDEIFRD